MRLHDKVILVTASTRGIGLAIVKKCAREGARVYMAARNPERALEKHRTALRTPLPPELLRGASSFAPWLMLTALIAPDKLPICMAKTQYSFSDNAALLGAPKGFTVTVRNLKVSAGAGFIVALTGDIMTMPGLPKVPSAEKIDVDETGKISGLF